MRLLQQLRLRGLFYTIFANIILVAFLWGFGYGFEKFRRAEIEFAEKAKELDPFGSIKNVDRIADVAGQLEFVRLAIDGKTDQVSLQVRIDKGQLPSPCDVACLTIKKAELESKLEQLKNLSRIDKNSSDLSKLSVNGEYSVVAGYLFANGTTKLGILTLLLFGFVTLNRLYQYMARLSSFYFARADALELLQALGQAQTVDNLDKLADIMTPAFVVLDKDSETLFQKFQEFVSSRFNLIPKRETRQSKTSAKSDGSGSKVTAAGD